ncbi:ABC-2 family transporter protein [Stieleria bergensis]|uniref:ABC-2 family transporter protein n=2 Tax=Stieleria bergensis TaxID=2528025 RepID=A0A517SR92_9BACT|nr:ABC-2 family transporter protein [Planctomycetes bacterium SV_7m_r]
MKKSQANHRQVAVKEHSDDNQRPRLSAIGMIYLREMRDQFRDRRTMFTIAVLPLVLYPLLGMVMMQVAQFSQQRPASVCVIGVEHLDHAPPLLEGDQFAKGLSDDQAMQVDEYRWDELSRNDSSAEASDAMTAGEQANQWVKSGRYDVALVIPPHFQRDELPGDAQITDLQNENKASGDPSDPPNTSTADNAHADVAVTPATANDVQLVFHMGRDSSAMAKGRVQSVLSAWRSQWVIKRIESNGIDPKSLAPFNWSPTDVASQRNREAAFWSKVLPFIMLIWAMTGAFYPAIDLVAGEKERGTLETLLCSPALRSEIVWGKMSAVFTFSMLTALLNAVSMLVTSSLVLAQVDLGPLSSMGSPPLIPMLWLLVALVPLSALFSALALAVAAMANSSKEGQYYLMPLMMVTLPLVMLPILPGTTLNVGTSLVPVTGMFLLVRSLIEGQYGVAMMYLPVVLTVTLLCLLGAARWAQHQFQSESVLFGAGDRWEFRLWLKHLWRDRKAWPTPAQAYLCGALILIALFFARFLISEIPTGLAGLAKMILLPQMVILIPAVLMACFLTRSPREALRIRKTHWSVLAMAVILGLTLHPTYLMISSFVQQMSPPTPEMLELMLPLSTLVSESPWWMIVLLMALLPAVCEELAFRGFVFGGLVRQGTLRAIVLSAFMFGISHGVLQQSIPAFVIGLLIGWVSLRTGSILPCLLIHLTNNSMSTMLQRIAESDWPIVNLFLHSSATGPAYNPLWTLVSMGLAATCLLYFGNVQSVSDEADSSDQEEADATALDAAGLASA